jgi:hypothetical protein
MIRKVEESGAFLKKSAQKTSSRWVKGVGGAEPMAQHNRSLFASFSSEKEALTSLTQQKNGARRRRFPFRAR